MRFRCLLKDRVLHYAPEYATKIIMACVVLHNMCLEYNVPLPEDCNAEHPTLAAEITTETVAETLPGASRVNRDLVAGRLHREQVIASL